jgi:hypothetical protein
METPEGKGNKDVKRIIHVGDIVLDSLEAIRTSTLSRFHP